MSARPCQRPRLFHSLWPCRKSRIRVGTRSLALASLAAFTVGEPTDGPSMKSGTLPTMALLRLFAAAREAAGVGSDEIPGETVDDVLAEARDRYGEAFATVLTACGVWLNGDEAAGDARVTDGDEIAVLPPVSGGA